MRKPIVCVDFDATIHGYQSGWRGVANIPDPPVPGAIAALLAMLDDGLDVAIYSARSRNIFGRWAMKRWLRKEIEEHFVSGSRSPSFTESESLGDAGDVVRRFSWPWFKPSAIITIDDRALTFNGNWNDIQFQPAALRSFKPWNKRSKS